MKTTFSFCSKKKIQPISFLFFSEFVAPLNRSSSRRIMASRPTSPLWRGPTGASPSVWRRAAPAWSSPPRGPWPYMWAWSAWWSGWWQNMSAGLSGPSTERGLSLWTGPYICLSVCICMCVCICMYVPYCGSN